MDSWNILAVVVLAVILLLVLPMVAARNGFKSFGAALSAPLRGRKKRTPLGLELKEKKEKPERHVNNSVQGELTAVVSQLITYTKRRRYTLVYPGTVADGGQLATTLALVVTPGGVVGLNCFGFAGGIAPGDKPDGPWKQRINGQDRTIPNPVAANRKQQALLRRAMDKAGLAGIPVEVIAVFTSKEARLAAPESIKCFSRDGMAEYLDGEAFRSGPVEDTHAVGVRLKALVTVYRPEKKAPRKARR